MPLNQLLASSFAQPFPPQKYAWKITCASYGDLSFKDKGELLFFTIKELSWSPLKPVLKVKSNNKGKNCNKAQTERYM